MKFRRTCWFLLCSLPAVGVAEEPAPISFRKQIRPILAANCFQCHGPDARARQADLRIDSAAGAMADRGGYAAVVPGDLEASELYKRIISDDESLKMPPPDSNKHLTAEQIDLLKQWIAQGAKYEQHWSFIPPERPALPAVSDPSWPKNAIDSFVLAELDRHGLKPSPAADRYQLARRLYLDLIGLPPTPAEADEFVQDDSAEAYERLVDKLLASPHYGERWARRWLDLARYSDTNGYEKDRPRTMWPYRDWVINSINQDMPFDQFTIEQIAGDMLPNATAQQRIATGFHRNTMVNEEGGIDPQEFRFNSIVDRVATTGTAWLGLTLGCAQCHTHKYDPLSHTEYYQVFALLNNADEVDEHVVTPEMETKRKEIEHQIGELIASLPKQFASGDSAALDRALDEWQRAAAAELAHWHSVSPARMKTNLATIAALDDHSMLVSGDVTKNDIYDLEFDAPGRIASVRIEALTHPSLPSGGPGRQSIEVAGASGEGDFFLSEMTAEVVEGNAENAEVVRQLEFASATETFATAGMSAASAFDGRVDTGWRVMGREGEPHTAVFQLREGVTLMPGQRLRFRLRHESFYPAGLGRFRFSFSSDEGNLPAALFPEEVASALRNPASERTPAQRQLLREHLLLHTPELKEAQEKITELKKQLPPPVIALVMQERTTDPRTTHRHHRGEFLKPDENISPGVPEILPPLPSDSPANRLTFARWLVDSNNPLTARVVVNRHWQALFGTGIVKTVDDFGLQGEFPSHPQLLDYLAMEFVESGWSRKQLHKLIVMSATYQQSAEVKPLHLERDPENRLLARAPRFRVDAEVVRDVVLGASGLLSPRIGGPSVFPDQPPGISEAAYGPLAWKVSTGEDRFRRGLYTFNKRTAPFASFGLFDAPSGEACVARRTYSNTPLQALAMLNDTTMQAAARALATSALVHHAGNDREIATEMFRRCVTRPPTDDELTTICEFHGRVAQEELNVAAILGGDEKADRPANMDQNALAAWTVTARAILNLDETINRQ